MDTSTYKTSTILVSTGRRTRVFKSMEDMPARLRKRVSENMAGPNSRTLVVADRRGREYLLKALNRAAKSTGNSRKPNNHQASGSRGNRASRYWIEIGLITLLAVISWALFHWK
jgi:hypothetical protein